MLSKSLSKISENFQMRQGKGVVRAPLNMTTGTLGEFSNIDDHSASRFTVENDKNVKSLSRLDTGGKLNHVKSDPFLKAYQRKNTVIPS